MNYVSVLFNRKPSSGRGRLGAQQLSSINDGKSFEKCWRAFWWQVCLLVCPISCEQIASVGLCGNADATAEQRGANR